MKSMPTSHPIASNILSVNADEEGQRIERFLKQSLPATPHNLLHKWLRSGQVRLNGARVKASAKLQNGDAVRLPPFCNLKQSKNITRNSYLSNNYRRAREQAKIKRMVVRNTEDYMILAKPAGMACQGGSGVYRSLDYMLTDAALENDRAKKINDTNDHTQNFGTPRLVHRLDKPTSGLLLIAKHRTAAAELTELFKQGRVRKIYCAILAKVPKQKQAKYTSSLIKIGGEGKEQAAETQLVMLDHCGLALVLLRPVSGRKHQLRRHMADAETPILGETIYTPRQEARVQRKKNSLRLHAMRLEINAEGLEKKYHRYALHAHLPPPKDFMDACEENFLDASKLADPSFDPFPT